MKNMRMARCGVILAVLAPYPLLAQCPLNPPTFVGIVAAPERLRSPYASAIDRAGHVFVTDIVTGEVTKFSSDGSTVLASFGMGAKADVVDIALTPDGTVYVINRGGNNIQRLTNALEPAGPPVRIPEPFGTPTCMAYDKDRQYLWLGLAGGSTIALTRSLSLVKNVLNEPLTLPGNASVTGLAVHNNVVYVTSEAGAIERWRLGVVGNGRLETQLLPALHPPVPPWRIVIDRAGSLFLTTLQQPGIQGNEIHQYGLEGETFSLKRCWGGPGAAQGLFDHITDVAVSADGKIQLVDNGNKRIQQFQLQASRLSSDALSHEIRSLSGPARVLTANGINQVRALPERMVTGTLVGIPKSTPASLNRTGDVIEHELPITLFESLPADGATALRFVVRQPASGLLRDTQTGRWSGALYVGIQDAVSREARPLTHAVRVTVAGDISPRMVTLDVTEVNRLLEIPLTTELPVDSVRISVDFGLLDEPYQFKIRRYPHITMTPRPRRVQAFGLEAFVITVGLEGDAPQTVTPVRLGAERAHVPGDSFLVGRGVDKSVRVRSGGLGQDEITASGASMTGSSIGVEYLFPWPFLVFSLLGGVLGSIIRQLWRDKPEVAALRLRLSSATTVVDAIAGVTFAVIATFGVNGLPLDSQALVAQAAPFVAGVAGAWFFPTLLRRVVGIQPSTS